MNKIIVSGRICNDLELRYTTSQKEYCSFNLAIPRDKDHTDFIKIATFGGTASLLNKYCKKGDKILVEGAIASNQYEKDGMKITDYSIMAQRIEFIEKKKEETKEVKTFKKDPFEETGKMVGAGNIEITEDLLPF